MSKNRSVYKRAKNLKHFKIFKCFSLIASGKFTPMELSNLFSGVAPIILLSP